MLSFCHTFLVQARGVGNGSTTAAVGAGSTPTETALASAAQGWGATNGGGGGGAFVTTHHPPFVFLQQPVAEIGMVDGMEVPLLELGCGAGLLGATGCNLGGRPLADMGDRFPCSA